MKFTLKGQKGFSIIELMIVVGIIGVLAAVGLPKMQVFLAKSKRTEAKTTLHGYQTYQEGYFADQGSYHNRTTIGYNLPASKYYTFNDGTSANSTTYTANETAAANGLCAGAASEVWTMNSANGLVPDNAANAAPTCN